jgi:Fe-S oxidoreductase
MAFIETSCDFCGECLARCAYVDYDKERAAFEMKSLVAGEDAPILSSCVSCFACNEFCPTGARPFGLILERQEQFGSLGIAPETIQQQEALYATTSPVQVERTGGRVLSACVFGRSDPGAGSVTQRHAQAFVDNLAATGADEVVLLHDDCYSMLVDRAPQVGVQVPFRPVHLFEYLRDFLEEHRSEVQPLGLKVAYQRPCASRLTPAKEEALDAVFQGIGVERVERQYDREGALCCSGAVSFLQPHLAADVKARNLDDAQQAGAEAMCYLCPMCRRTLAQDAEARGLANHHVIDLVRMALGELPGPAAHS